MDWWPWHQYEYSNLSKSWPMAHMETSYSTETIANPCLSIWRRVCLTNMIQEFIKIIIPNHCADGGLTARTGDIGAESRPLSLFFCQMTQRWSSSVLPFSTCVYVLQQLGSLVPKHQHSRPSRPVGSGMTLVTLGVPPLPIPILTQIFQHHGTRSPGSMSQDLSHKEQPSCGSGALCRLSTI